MKMKKKNHDSDSKGKQANPPAKSPHHELVTHWSSKETARGGHHGRDFKSVS